MPSIFKLGKSASTRVGKTCTGTWPAVAPPSESVRSIPLCTGACLPPANVPTLWPYGVMPMRLANTGSTITSAPVSTRKFAAVPLARTRTTGNGDDVTKGTRVLSPLTEVLRCASS